MNSQGGKSIQSHYVKPSLLRKNYSGSEANNHDTSNCHKVMAIELEISPAIDFELMGRRDKIKREQKFLKTKRTKGGIKKKRN